jgi:dTDP-4-dehydrorhamnose 3,5-epimerase-like enzyme
VTNSASALVLYLQSGPYCAEHDGGVNMSQFLLPEHTDVIFSDRDKSLPLIDDFSGISTAKWMRT